MGVGEHQPQRVAGQSVQIVVEAAEARPDPRGPATRLGRVKGFASDNYAAAHPQVLAAIAEANDAHAVSYGADPWTARAEELLREHFGEQARSRRTAPTPTVGTSRESRGRWRRCR